MGGSDKIGADVNHIIVKGNYWMSGSKRWQLHKLVEKRRATKFQDYFGENATALYGHVGEFHDGVFECAYVSPWTISASNVDARYMVVGQDWSSRDQLAKPPSRHVIDHGFDPKFKTNANLELLLNNHLQIKRCECYLTNLFPFIKSGAAGTVVPPSHLERCARDFLVPQIEIVGAPLVICLGLQTFNALMKAVGQATANDMGSAIAGPREFQRSKLCAVAHTGTLGTKNRGGMDQVHIDWQQLAALAH
jgi:hypothetical protein